MTTDLQQAVPCLICQQHLVLRLARGRKSGKPFIMLMCPQDGRHLRAFITHQPYVREVLARLEGQTQATDVGDEQDRHHAGHDDDRHRACPQASEDQAHGHMPSHGSGSVLERGRAP